MPRRILQGTVTSDAMDKTITVKVEKFIVRSKKYLAHDETNRAKEGDNVKIRECRPISKRKRWEIVTEDAAS
jgi:small subunit ribosomal protein S17